MPKYTAALTAACLALLALGLLGCASSTSSISLPQIQTAGNTLVSTIKTDVALFEAQTPLDVATQGKITIALNALTAANVVLQGLSTSATAANYVATAQAVVAAGVSVVNALPAGTIPATTLQEVDAAAFAFQLAAGLAQQAITAAQTPAPASP